MAPSLVAEKKLPPCRHNSSKYSCSDLVPLGMKRAASVLEGEMWFIRNECVVKKLWLLFFVGLLCCGCFGAVFARLLKRLPTVAGHAAHACHWRGPCERYSHGANQCWSLANPYRFSMSVPCVLGALRSDPPADGRQATPRVWKTTALVEDRSRDKAVGVSCPRDELRCRTPQGNRGKDEVKLVFVDVTKAHSNARCDEQEWAELPEEFVRYGKYDSSERWLYGMRKAALPQTNDDFTFDGTKVELMKVQAMMRGVGTMSRCSGLREAQDVEVLGRTCR